MRLRAYLFFILRYISRKNTDRGARRMRSAVIAIALSLVPLVTVIELSSGMIEGITRRYLEIGSFHLQVRFFEQVEEQSIDSIVKMINDHPEVTQTFEIVESNGLLYSETNRTGVVVRALEPDFFERSGDLSDYVSFSEGPDVLGTGQVIVSAGAAEELGISTGEEVRLLTARSIPNGRFLLKQSAFPVGSTFTTGYGDLDGNTVLIPFERALSLFRGSGNRAVGVKVRDPYAPLGEVTRAIESGLPNGAYIFTWNELERGMYTSFRTTKTMLMLAMGVIVCVAAITISSSLIILVKERETDIAILKSTGARNRDITLSFVALGFVSGCIGTAIGLATGIAISININAVLSGIESIVGFFIMLTHRVTGTGGAGEFQLLDPSYYLQEISIELELSDLFIVSVLSIALSTLSAWGPASRAGRVRPIESLQRH